MMTIRRRVLKVNLGYNEKGKKRLLLTCQTNELSVKLEDRYVVCYGGEKWPFNVVEIEASDLDSITIRLEEAHTLQEEKRLVDKEDLDLRVLLNSEFY